MRKQQLISEGFCPLIIILKLMKLSSEKRLNFNWLRCFLNGVILSVWTIYKSWSISGMRAVSRLSDSKNWVDSIQDQLWMSSSNNIGNLWIYNPSKKYITVLWSLVPILETSKQKQMNSTTIALSWLKFCWITLATGKQAKLSELSMKSLNPTINWCQNACWSRWKNYTLKISKLWRNILIILLSTGKFNNKFLTVSFKVTSKMTCKASR